MEGSNASLVHSFISRESGTYTVLSYVAIDRHSAHHSGEEGIMQDCESHKEGTDVGERLGEPEK